MSQAQVRLRPVTEADLPDYVCWFNDPEVTQFMAAESGGYTLEREQEWFRKINAPDYPNRHWAIELDGRHIGNCALMPDSDGQTAGFGIMIGDKGAWGKGYGTAALREVLRIGFQEMGLHRIHLEAFAGNARGIGCYEKCGFRHEGLHRQARWKRGERVDIVSMAVLREEWREQAGASAPAGDPLIRSYRAGDHDQVIALWQDVGFNPRAGDTPEALAYKLSNDRGPFLVVIIEGRIVGTGMASWDGRWAWVSRVAVDPAHQRQGIGRRLMAALEEQLAALGAERAYLITSKENGPARSFYESLGYQVADGLLVMRKGMEEACCHGPGRRATS